MAIATPKTIGVVVTGSDGSATGDGSVSLTGKILAIHIDYPSDAPATTVVAVSQTTTPTKAILTVSNNNTDGWYNPREKADDVGSGEDMTYDGAYGVVVPLPVSGTIQVAVSNANEGTYTVTIVYET